MLHTDSCVPNVQPRAQVIVRAQLASGLAQCGLQKKADSSSSSRGKISKNIKTLKDPKIANPGGRVCSPQHSATSVDVQSPQAPTHTHEAIITYCGYCGIPQHGVREAVSPTLVGLVTLYSG